MRDLATQPLVALLCDLLRDHPLREKVFLVGGAVRDAVLERDTKDYDLCVEVQSGAEAIARFLSEKAPHVFSSPHNLGAGYPIWQLTIKPDGLEGFAGIDIEIADTQSEMFPDPATRQRVTRFGNLDEDCRRRDFTSNMLYYSLGEKRIVDPSGRGLADIEEGQLELHPQVEGRQIFSDDPLRVLRLIRFHAQLAFDIGTRAWAAAEETADRLAIVSAERIRDEFSKMAESGRFETALDLMQKMGLVAKVFPELLPMVGAPQDSRYHSEGDVWTHTLLVVKNAPKTLVLQLAALLHDIAKPVTTTIEGDRIRHLGHDKVSATMTEEFLKRLKFSRKTIDTVSKLVLLHLRGGDALQWKSLKPARKLLRDAGDEINDLLRLIEADSRSSFGPDGKNRVEHLGELQTSIAKAKEIPLRAKALISGQDVMEILGLKPGPAIRQVQDFVSELEDEAAADGRHLSFDEAQQAILRERARFGA